MKVAIAGYGLEGKASLTYWRAKGDDVTVLDEQEIAGLPEGVSVVTGPDVFSNFADFDVVIRTASLRPDRLVGAKKVWSATNEFFAECPAPIIGVTGTKGKGTTCSLIVSILRAAGKTVHLVGNIGTPALDVLPSIQASDIVVFEMSSFQLWDLEKSPATAVVLMIEPDHLDVHADMAEYIAAKARITSSQTANGKVIYHPTNEISAHIASLSVGQKIRYNMPDDGGAYVKANTFFVQSDAIGSVDTLQVVGQHNIENACAAISAAWLYTHDDEAILQGLHDFTGLPHRLKFIREVDGVKYYDDSIATTPGSAIAALNSFLGSKVIILGGSDKGADYHEIVATCKEKDASIIAIGQTGEVIKQLASAQGVDVYRVEGMMNEVIAKSREIATAGSVVILSPASASFDQYKNYADRGNQFIAAVQQL